MQKKRRSPPQAAPTPVSTAATAGLARSISVLLIVALLIACYVVAFYIAQPFRAQIIALLITPDDVMASWSANGKLPGGLADRLPIFAIAGVILAVAWTSGSLVVRGWKLDARLTRLETEIFCLGVGLSLWSIWTLLIGLCGLLHQTWIVWLPAIVSASLAGFLMAARRAEAPREVTSSTNQEPGDWLWTWMLALGIPFALFYLFAAGLPPRPNLEFDVCEYHLQVPKEWHEAGQITFLPHNVYGNMPLGAEMFPLLGMTLMPGDDGWWYGALVGKVVMAATSILTALLLYAAGQRSGSRSAGVVAALVYISTPWTYLVSVSGRNEGVLAFYLALAVYAVWLWRFAPDCRLSLRESSVLRSAKVKARYFRGAKGDNPETHLLKLAGFFAGSAAAVKYTGVVFVVLPLLLFVVFGARKFAWKPGVVFLIGALAACGLWHAKNAALTGNPVYPLAYNIFGGETRTPEKAAQWASAHRTPEYSLAELGTEAKRIVLDSEWLSPLLIPLAACAALAFTQRNTAIWLAAFLAFYLVCWFLFTHRLDRFWTPALVVVAWLAGIGASWSGLKAWRHVVIALLFWGLVWNFLTISFGAYVATAQDALPDQRILVSLAALRKENTSAAHRYLNEHCPRGAQVLLVGDAQPFDLAPTALYNTCFDDVWFDTFFKDKTRAERLAALREQKIAYIYISWSEIDRYRSPGNYGFSDYITRKLVRDEMRPEDGFERFSVGGKDGDVLIRVTD